MTSVPDTQNDVATGYPETWKFAEHGDLVAGTFVRFDEGPTRDYGLKVILVLDVDGVERSVWLSQTALFNKVKDELNRRTSNTLEPGERVIVQRHGKTTSENGRSYWPFAVSFPDRPEKSTADLFGLDEGHVKEPGRLPTPEVEGARLPTPEAESAPVDPDDGIPF